MGYIFDIEAYRNFFSVIFKDVNSADIKTFVIFEDRNDLDGLNAFINDRKKWLIGYNSHYYDNQMLNYISENYRKLKFQTNKEVCDDLKNLSDNIINYDFKEYKYNLPFQGIDLMKVGNLEQKPLKLVAVNLKWPRIQDLPIDPDDLIQASDVDELLSYNLNDVEITEELYNRLKPFIQLRWDISKKYGVNVMDESDSGISNRLLEKIFSEELKIPVWKLKEMQTIRGRVPFREIIFDEIVFKTPQLQGFLGKLKGEVFEEDVYKFSEKIIFGGTAYQLGIGGIHSDDKPALFVETDEIKLIDADVGSYYPSAIINHKVAPKHLGSGFIAKYKEIRDDRLIAKHIKDMITADTLKIVINAAFGKMNSKTHWLRDVKAMLQVTVNCQLYLLMLIEKLVMSGFKILSANTDGVVAVVERDREELYKSLCEEWEVETDFVLEYAEYKKYARRDVNNYITIKTDNKIKLKGEFETEKLINNPALKVQLLKKGYNAPIVPIALYEYYVNGTPIEQTIRNHDDIYDFCIAKKSDKKFTNEFHYLDGNKAVVDELQRTNRYYVSTSGGKIYKTEYSKNLIDHYTYTRGDARWGTKEYSHSDNLIGRKDVCVGHTLTLFNDYFESDNYNIDYSYYISKARKIKELVEDPQLTLF